MRNANALRRASAAVLAASVGCIHAPAATPPLPEPVFFILAVPATADSTITLARTALREINGTPQQPSFANNVTSVTTHYVRTRQDGGETRVAVVLEVSHKVADPSVTVTGVRLSAWALETPGEFLNRSGPAPPTRRYPSAAALTSSTAPPRTHPRAITETDDFDVAEMLHVLEALVKYGARRMP